MDDLEAIGLLHEPVRRALYDYVVAQDHEVSRREVAEATSTQRTLAAFHLDKLVEAGLLETSSRRVSGRTGPGAGRPAKLYRRAADERHVALPPRDYRMVAELLADAVDAARLDDRLHDVALRRGIELGGGIAPAGTDAVLERLRAQGYEPYLDGDVVRMRNCPFHALSLSHPTLVCGMNRSLLEGLLSGATGVSVVLDPRPTGCCTAVLLCQSRLT